MARRQPTHGLRHRITVLVLLLGCASYTTAFHGDILSQISQHFDHDNQNTQVINLVQGPGLVRFPQGGAEEAEKTNESGGSYHAEDTNKDLATEIQRLHAQAVAWWPQEKEKLRYFGLRDGMQVLDIGCGPGFITRELLRSFPHAHVTGVERDEKLLDLAKRRNVGSGRWKGYRASIDKMPLASNHYDFAVVRYLAQHLPDPISAFKEVLRVLKPNAVIVVIDIDDQLSGIFQPGVHFQKQMTQDARLIQAMQRRAQVMRQFDALQAHKGGNRQIGRYLIPLLQDVGFSPVRIEMAVIDSDEIGLAPFKALAVPDPFSWELYKKQLISRDDLQACSTMLNLFFADPTSIIYSQEFIVAGRKPKATQ